jgi:hypothetical protein
MGSTFMTDKTQEQTIVKKERLIEKKDVAKESLTFFFGLLSTAIGFFVAVYFNNKLEKKSEYETFKSIKKSIIAEIEENKRTIDGSFYTYLENGITFNELSTGCSREYLTHDVFLKFAHPQLLITLQAYIHKCDMCNKQEEQLKQFRINQNGSTWETGLQAELKNTLIATEKVMQMLINELEGH